MAPKPCTLCQRPQSLLVRCQIDSSQTWHFVCPGKCWRSVSGGVEDARGFKEETGDGGEGGGGRFEWYRYGGMVCILCFLWVFLF
jgi:hypothetical protein